MAQATVLSVTGNAVVVQADGTTRALKVGDVIQKGETIRTAAGARVELMMEDGQVVAMGPAQALRVDETMAQTEATPDAQAAAAQGATVDQITQVLEAGGDLTEELEAAAAGGGAGGGGDGSNFIRLLRVAEGVDPLAYDYTFDPLGSPDDVLLSSDLEPDDQPTVEVLNSNPEATTPGGFVFESGLLSEDGSQISSGVFNINTGGDALVSLTVNGQDVTGGGVVVGANGALTITLVEGVYNWSYVLNKNLPHLGADNEVTESDTFTVVVTDDDGDTASASFTVAAYDDTPTAELNSEQDLAPLVLDESPEDDLDTEPSEGDGVRSASVDIGQYFAVPQFGADAPGSVGYALVLTGTAVGSGLFAVDASAIDGKGAEILLYQDGDVVIGKVGDEEYFRISLDTDPESSSFGQLTFSQAASEGVSIWHDTTDNHDDSVFLTVDAGDGEERNSLQVVQTVTDSDLDEDQAFFDLGQGFFEIQDDGPSVTNEGQQNVAEGGTQSGQFDFVAGADGGGVSRHQRHGVAVWYGRVLAEHQPGCQFGQYQGQGRRVV